MMKFFKNLFRNKNKSGLELLLGAGYKDNTTNGAMGTCFEITDSDGDRAKFNFTKQEGLISKLLQCQEEQISRIDELKETLDVVLEATAKLCALEMMERQQAEQKKVQVKKKK